MAVHKEAVSVTEMARMVGLGRTRFYQLVKDGIFPPPAHDAATRLPFYTRELQNICLDVRNRNCGVNGKLVVFRSERTKTPRSTQTRPATNGRYDDLAKGLRSMGLPEVTSEQVNEIMNQLYPNGVSCVDGQVLRNVFLAIRGVDNG